MYKQELQFKVMSEIKNDLPLIRIGIRFNDYFTKDTYALISEIKSNTKDLTQIPFRLFINNEPDKLFILNENKVLNLLSEAFDSIQDFDFQKEFNEEIKQVIQEQVVQSLENYEHQVLLNEVNIVGELKRMSEIAGISKKYILK